MLAHRRVAPQQYIAGIHLHSWVACEHALLFGREKQTARERANGELARRLTPG